jgi:diadenosine tetraphosphatase ApaH/serine/threonine PP2A family protein phosphatase
LKLGVLSDIHGNLEALQAVLAALRAAGAESFLCCGDVVGYGPDPGPCVAEVRGLGGPVAAGNHDWGVAGLVPPGHFNASARAAVAWTSTVLDRGDRDWLGALELSVAVGPDRLVHAAPSAPGEWEYVLTTRHAALELAGFDGRVCFAGHTHRPMATGWRHGEPAMRPELPDFRLEPGVRHFVNAGSVGQPRDGDPRACCLVYDDEAGTVKFLRVEYDVTTVQRKIRRAGLPGTLADRLAEGR